MKGDASLFAAIDLGSNAFRMIIGQSVRRRQGFVIQEVKTLREPVRLAEGSQGGALSGIWGFGLTSSLGMKRPDWYTPVLPIRYPVPKTGDWSWISVAAPLN
jgi:hypothetical protein